MHTYFFGILGPLEWVIIIAIILLVYGGKKLPGLAKGFGESIRNFKTSLKGEEESNKEQKVQDPNR